MKNIKCPKSLHHEIMQNCICIMEERFDCQKEYINYVIHVLLLKNKNTESCLYYYLSQNPIHVIQVNWRFRKQIFIFDQTEWNTIFQAFHTFMTFTKSYIPFIYYNFEDSKLCFSLHLGYENSETYFCISDPLYALPAIQNLYFAIRDSQPFEQ